MSDTSTTNGTLHGVETRRTLTNPPGPIGWFLRLFSSIWLGVTLLTLLFIYSSIGSAGLLTSPAFLSPDSWMPLREAFEMSEFEWFHWWPFDTIIAMICLNLVVATLRRIPFNTVNLGVWMIHTGIITLAIGSVWYFGTKVEGDAPVARRMVTVSVPGHDPTTLIASPGQAVSIGDYSVRVFSCTPDWELLSGDDAGKRAFKATMLVQKDGEFFLRELIAGFPQYTEDLVASDDPAQPFARAKKTRGTAIVDDEIDLAMDYAAQDWFCLQGSRAIYLREFGATEWVQRPIDRMPLWNDRVGSFDDIWVDGTPPAINPFTVEVSAVEESDPLPDVTFTITEYLRYASMESRRVPGGDRLNPAASVAFRRSDGQAQSYELVAFDEQRRMALGGALAFLWADSEEVLDRLRGSRPPTLAFRVPGASFEVQAVIPETAAETPDLAFTPLGATGYSYRVLSLENGLDIGSLARVELRHADRADVIERWVFDNPALSRDGPVGQVMGVPPGTLSDAAIEVIYDPGDIVPNLMLVAGPGESDLRFFVNKLGGYTEHDLVVGEPFAIADSVSFEVTSISLRSHEERRPRIVPERQRQTSANLVFSMARINVPTGNGINSSWLPFHQYPFARQTETLRRSRYEPRLVQMADGRWFEIMFSRKRLPLPEPVALDDFRLTTHIGGFSGDTSSILDWSSVIVFDESGRDAGEWSEPLTVSVNSPKEHAGYWYFQSQWDPPTPSRGSGDPGSEGLNYTVLGVANRNGVLLQLLGCCISAIGMLYAFYVKPIVKRRRQQAVYASVARSKQGTKEGARREAIEGMIEEEVET